ncbi:hypothetical protein R2G56_21085 [Nitratireductor aquimarinus]|uniref:Uncharacterized protein n=1 Tax=Nitratireductor aquimarinus TaxID=889300 RepID=A0ABU4ARB7_9HYPH|nr:hypothetical protein [Nitratireductor aquimarinus]MDV6228790.1 hypothetical protein [Nitratireductor aquimarinus]
MTTRNDVYNHIGDALQNTLPEDGSAEIGMDHNKLFLRMGSQVFAISVEEKQQFRKAEDPERQARNFMSTLPFWPWQSDR